jgi:hypothetical protein
MGVMGALGPLSEININSLCIYFLGSPLWVYHVLPVHGGSTSMVMSIFWPTYGWHIYFFHTALRRRYGLTDNVDLSLLFGIDGILMETLVNIFTITLFSTFVFYYIPNDLSHLSTVNVYVIYALAGYVWAKVIHYLRIFKQDLVFGIVGLLIGWSIIFIL